MHPRKTISIPLKDSLFEGRAPLAGLAAFTEFTGPLDKAAADASDLLQGRPRHSRAARRREDDK